MSTNQQPSVPVWQPAPPARIGPAEGVAYAGFWIRLVAWMIDAIAIGILTSALAPFGPGAAVTIDGSRIAVNTGANAFGALLGLVYWVGFWSWKGQTLGMMPFGLFVVRVVDGRRPDVVEAFLRFVGLIISFAVLLLGVIWIAFDPRKQGWHDKMARTLVVRR